MRSTRPDRAKSADQEVARQDSGTAPRGLPSRSRLDWLVVAIPMLAELIVGGYRIGGPSLWRDEAATISGSQRSFGDILTMMGKEDAVHGPYYLLMHPVVAIGGISATALRLPSLIAMCLAAGLTAALARRLAASSGLPGAQAVGLIAGLTLAAVPLTTRYAQEARPYALATLFAVLATYLLVRAAAEPRPARWALCSAALLLTGLFNLFAVLVAVAHGVSLAWGLAAKDRASAFRGWLTACVAVAIVLAPLAYLSAGQASQLNWVTRPDASTIASLLRDFAGAAVLIPVVGLIAVLGCFAGQGFRRGTGLTLATVALPWLVLPPVVLIVASFAHPVYVERYVVFCLPALAMLIAAGLVWLAAATRRALAGRELGARGADALAIAPSAVLALVIVLAVIGPQRAIRQVGARVDNLRAVATAMAAMERSGDAVLYLPRDAALVGVPYPAPFRRLRDIGLGESPVVSATLRGTEASPSVIAVRLRDVRRLWTIQWANPLSRSTAVPASLAALLAPLQPAGQWRIQSVLLRLYVRKR